MTNRRLVAAACCVVALAACGDGEPTARVRDTRLARDGSAVFIALERGTVRTEGNLFSGHSVRSIDRVELHRLDLTTGAVSTLRSQALSGDAATLSVADLTSDPLGDPLPDCRDIHSECVARTVPAPFLVTQPDLFDKSIVAPVPGVRIAWNGSAFASTAFTVRTADEARASADATMRRTVALIDATSHTELAALQARDAPELREPGGERGTPGLAAAREGTRVAYRFLPDGAVLATLSTDSAAAARIAWMPDRACTTDSRLVARAVAECRLVDEKDLDAALADLDRRARRTESR